MDIKPGSVLLAPISNRDPASIPAHPTLWAFVTVDHIFAMSGNSDYPDEVVMVRTDQTYLCLEDIDPRWVFGSHPLQKPL